MKLIAKPNLPKELFAVTAKPELLAQAVRVHLANQRQGTQNAKTRAEINRTRKKLYKQKGTGGARHGDRKAPIFVGGGIVFAPKPRDHSLKLPTRMRSLAFAAALSAKNKEGKVAVVSGMGKLTGKTKEAAALFTPGSLVVTDGQKNNVYQAARNIAKVTILPVKQLNVYEVLKADKLFLMEEIFAKPKVAKTKKA